MDKLEDLLIDLDVHPLIIEYIMTTWTYENELYHAGKYQFDDISDAVVHVIEYHHIL